MDLKIPHGQISSLTRFCQRYQSHTYYKLSSASLFNWARSCKPTGSIPKPKKGLQLPVEYTQASLPLSQAKAMSITAQNQGNNDSGKIKGPRSEMGAKSIPIPASSKKHAAKTYRKQKQKTIGNEDEDKESIRGMNMRKNLSTRNERRPAEKSDDGMVATEPERRPPSVNSPNIPIPWKGRFGYVFLSFTRYLIS